LKCITVAKYKNTTRVVKTPRSGAFFVYKCLNCDKTSGIESRGETVPAIEAHCFCGAGHRVANDAHIKLYK